MSVKNRHRLDERELHRLTPEELEENYGIKINEKGQVFDPCYGRIFDSLNDWVEFELKYGEGSTGFEKISGKEMYDDYY